MYEEKSKTMGIYFNFMEMSLCINNNTIIIMAIIRRVSIIEMDISLIYNRCIGYIIHK